MRQFYLGKTSSGYYKAYFIDPVTGIRDYGKSTGTKDKLEAAVIANEWLKNGKPVTHANSRKLKSDDSILVPTSLKSFVDRLSESDAKTVVAMLSEKFGFDSPVLSQKPVELGKPVVEALAPVSSPVQAPAPTPAESPKPKKVIVIKKSPDGKMKLVKNEKPALKDGASFVPSIGLTPDGKHLLCDNLFELKPFTNQSMIPSMGKIPYFTLTAYEKEQGKKDRIIDTINYKFNFEFFYEKDDIPAYEKTICYQQIICQMLHEDDFEYWLNFEVPKLTQRKFELLVLVEW